MTQESVIQNISREEAIRYLREHKIEPAPPNRIQRLVVHRRQNIPTVYYLVPLPPPEGDSVYGPRTHVNLNDYEEMVDYSEMYRNELDIELLPLPVPLSSQKRRRVDVSPWFDAQTKQYQNYLNERELMQLVTVKRVDLPLSYYDSLKECGAYVCEVISAHLFPSALMFEYDAKRNVCTFSLHPSLERLRVVSDSRYLTQIFGIWPKRVLTSRTNSQQRSYVYEFPCQSLRNPSLDIVRTIMMYSDIGEFIHTGDVKTPHLARFPVAGVAHGDQFQWLAAVPQYVRVTRNSFDTINIRCHDVYGNLLPFSKSTDSPVSCVLHFKRTSPPAAIASTE